MAKLWQFLASVIQNRHRPTQKMSFGPPGGSGGSRGGPKMPKNAEKRGGGSNRLKKEADFEYVCLDKVVAFGLTRKSS